MSKKIYHPLSLPFLFFMTLLNIFLVGLIYLIIIGVIKFNLMHIIIGIVGFIFLILVDIKIISWKVFFNEDYIFVPSSIFDKYIKGQQKEQKIYYSDIKEVNFIKLPVQILSIRCHGKNRPNVIYVKQFSKKQIKMIIEEINSKIK